MSALAVGDPDHRPGVRHLLHARRPVAEPASGRPAARHRGRHRRAPHFPLDGEYQFQVALTRTNLEAIRGLEHQHQLEITIDGERVFLGPVGGDAEAGQTGAITARSDATDARLRVRVPVKAGPRLVAAAFIRKIAESTNRLRPFLRSNAGTYDSTGRPHVKSLTVAGPFNPTGPGRHAEPPRGVRVPSRDAPPPRSRCARRILTTLARRAYRRPVNDRRPGSRCSTFYRDGRKKGSFDTGIQLALRRLLASPTFVFRIEEDPAAGRARRGLSHQRPRAGVAALVLPLEQHARRRAARPRGGGTPAPAGGARGAGAAHAGRPEGRRAGARTSPGSGCTSATCRTSRPTPTSSRTSTTTCATRSGARPSCSSPASCARTATCSTC